jgi:Xaa-Pro aminopeptidase
MFDNEVQDIDFAARRKAFLGKIGSGIAVFPSAPEITRYHDGKEPYRQESNFYYLTGFEEPSSITLLSAKSDTPFQIFVLPKNPQKELWEGKTLGPEVARQRTLADVSYPSEPPSFFDAAFIDSIRKADALYYRVGVNADFDRRIFKLLELAASVPSVRNHVRPLWPIHDPEDILGEMRLIKSRAEISRLQQAAFISSEAHVNAMRITKPGMFEYEVEAVLQHAFRINGARRLAYSTRVASGANTCVLKYHLHNRRMTDQDLILVDGGAEYDYYAADITRVYPVGGKFSEEQREIYSIVLNAQKECIAMSKPGKTLGDLHARATEIITEGLRGLKVIKGSLAQCLKKKAYLPYFPHMTSHWLGMDVNDTGRDFYKGI